MIENIIIFENDRVEDLYPFNIMHCSWELRTGIYMNFEKIIKLFNKSKIKFIGRELQLKSFLKRFNIENKNFGDVKNILLIDGCFVITQNTKTEIEQYCSNIDKNLIFKFNNQNVSYFLCNNINNLILEDKINYDIITENAETIELKNGYFINYLWDALDYIENGIRNDIIIHQHLNRLYLPAFHNVNAIVPSEIYVEDNVKIAPSVCLDASYGPIFIDESVKIYPQATILGPCYIGKNSEVKIGAKIYKNNIIGPVTKVAGELQNNIIQSYTNKQHDGFLGDSYICEWVNLGADTNNSNLKNTLSNIKVRLPHKTIDTKKLFLGMLCGDHTKTAINTQINTGTVIGISSIIFESGFPPTTIKSFDFGGFGKKKYSLENAIETAKKIMSRRNKELTEEEIKIFEEEYNKNY